MLLENVRRFFLLILNSGVYKNNQFFLILLFEILMSKSLQYDEPKYFPSNPFLLKLLKYKTNNKLIL